MVKTIWQSKIIKLLWRAIKFAIIVIAIFWIVVQMVSVVFFGPTLDIIGKIVGDKIMSAIFSDYSTSQSSSDIIVGVGAIFDTTYYAIYSIISIVAAILGTIILSRKRNIYEVLGMLGAFTIPNERKNWGSIRDENTKKPIPFAVIRLVEAQNGSKENDVLQTVSDLDGRYRLYVNNPSLSYNISVHAAGYVDLVRKLDVYEDPTKSNLFVEDLYLTKVSKEQANLRSELNYLRPRFYWYLIITFYILSLFYVITGILYVVAFPDSVYGVVQLAVFAAAFAWNTKIIWERTHSRHGRLIDHDSKKQVPNIGVDLYNDKGQVANTSSDVNGLVKFDINPGKYQLRLSSNLYKLENEQKFIQVLVDDDGYINKNIPLISLSSVDAEAKENPFA